MPSSFLFLVAMPLLLAHIAPTSAARSPLVASERSVRSDALLPGLV